MMVMAMILVSAIQGSAACRQWVERIERERRELLEAYVDGAVTLEKFMRERNRRVVVRDVVWAWCAVHGEPPEDVRAVLPGELLEIFPRPERLPETLLPGGRYRAGGVWWMYVGKRRIGEVFLVFVR